MNLNEGFAGCFYNEVEDSILDALDYLKSVRKCDVIIENKIRELEDLRDMTMKITSTISDEVVSGSRDPNRLSNAVVRIIDLETEIDNAVDEYVDRREDVTRVIDSLDDARLVDLLHRRYLQGQTWEQIAFEMGYTYQWICELNKMAIDEVQMLLSNT